MSRVLKLRTVYTGSAPAGVNYRFQLTYESEEAPPEMDQVRRAPEGVAHGGKHSEHEELLDPVVRFEVDRIPPRRPERARSEGVYHCVALTLLGIGRCWPACCRSPRAKPLAARIAHTDPARYRHSPAVHGGAGSLDFTALFDAHTLEPNLQFLHRGVIQPKSGIGAHFHNQCEEMFVILDGEAAVHHRRPYVAVEGTGRRSLPHGPFARDLQPDG